MSSLRSARAQRRAARVRNARIIVIAILVLAVALGAFFAIQKGQQKAVLQAPSGGGNMTTTQSGLQYEDLVVGTGVEAIAGKNITVHYTGTLQDGTVFDSSVTRNQPFSFTLGAGQVIPGWDEGIAGMKVGGKRKLVIPPALAYGAQGSSPVIPANATLTFVVELLEVK
jgi:FKBP-type peptidyl-prolyl cis-trans isomerase